MLYEIHEHFVRQQDEYDQLIEYFQILNNQFYLKLIFVDNRMMNNHDDLIQDFQWQDHWVMKVEEVFVVIPIIQCMNMREEFSIDMNENIFQLIIDYQKEEVKI